MNAKLHESLKAHEMRTITQVTVFYHPTMSPFMPSLQQSNLWSCKTQPQTGSSMEPVGGGEITKQALSLGFSFLLPHFLQGSLKTYVCLI